MRTVGRLCFVLLCMVGLLGTPGWSIGETLHATFTIHTDKRDMNGELWTSSGRMRMEMEVPGMGHQIIIHNDTETLMVMLERHMAMRLPNPPANLAQASEGYRAPKNATSHHSVGTQVIRGITCTGEEYITSDGKTTIWMSSPMRPVRVESEGKGGRVQIDYLVFETPTHLDDSLFQLPAGVKVMDIPAGAFPNR